MEVKTQWNKDPEHAAKTDFVNSQIELRTRERERERERTKTGESTNKTNMSFIQ